ncbi:uncharacterized protein IWZ02DRAFT_19479 [Phyllosticta citriasiana]|uniref:Uncharacterized protein n=1 Tax=Phyllosticta citriasiana TaxID=595635 RepID=A0ABR1KEN0_9PEZI
MAASDIDQKYLAHIAHLTSATHPTVSGPFFQVLGLSQMLSARVLKARKMRRLDLTRDTPSLTYYQHIIWLVREGLEILENKILPHTMNGQLGAEATVLTAKLRASLYHLLSLFHNQPPVSQVPPPRSSTASRGDTTAGVLGPSHRHNNSKSSIVSEKFSPKANQGKSKNGSRARTPTLRDPVASATSDASFITNPYANNRPGSAVSSPAPPPGLGGPTIPPQPSAFLFPPMNFLPMTESHFVSADKAATTLLPGSHPLRLSVAIEHCAFIWDCLHDFQYARRLARQTIRAVYHAKEGMDDDDFEEAAKMVDHLGKIMKRRSWDGATRPIREGVPGKAQEVPSTQKQFVVSQEPLIEEELSAQVSPPSIELPKHLPTQESFVEQEYEKAGGGLRGFAYLDEHLRKPTTIQHQRCLKRRMPMNTQVQQVRNENDASLTSNLRFTHPHGPEQADDPLDEPDPLLSDLDSECSATNLDHYDHKSFRTRKTGGTIPQSSALTAVPESHPNATLPRSSTVSALSRPPPIDIEKANEFKNQIVDEYEWSPRKHREKSFMLRNMGGVARFRNEAFPPLDGARLEGMPIFTEVPTPYQLPNGEVRVFQQWRWVQPVTVFDPEKYHAALKKREEEFQEKRRREAYQAMLELGRAKGEQLKGQMQVWFAQVAKDNGQQHM